MKKYLPIVLLICFAFTACENTWDSDTKDMFHQSCMKTARENGTPEAAAKDMCDCRLELMMEKYPHFDDAMANIQKIMTDPDFKKCEPKAY